VLVFHILYAPPFVVFRVGPHQKLPFFGIDLPTQLSWLVFLPIFSCSLIFFSLTGFKNPHPFPLRARFVFLLLATAFGDEVELTAGCFPPLSRWCRETFPSQAVVYAPGRSELSFPFSWLSPGALPIVLHSVNWPDYLLFFLCSRDFGLLSRRWFREWHSTGQDFSFFFLTSF